MINSALIKAILFLLLVVSSTNVVTHSLESDWLGALMSSGVAVFVTPSRPTVAWIHSRLRDKMPTKQWIGVAMMIAGDATRIVGFLFAG
ncbi:MAG TPA: hypothetical protein DEG76_06895 [Pseudohongiella sp.]|nr:hypothetical protein [Pseudohongiella sp.]HBX37011.1 hypothetical protein [Pseudohongiella sp.]|tara:strand:- start:234433 stop:234699 length:267 start_codon:yes stop_codon:yes gene_type:complete